MPPKDERASQHISIRVTPEERQALDALMALRAREGEAGGYSTWFRENLAADCKLAGIPYPEHQLYVRPSGLVIRRADEREVARG